MESPLSVKERMQIPSQPMPHRDPAVRKRLWDEVATGYSPEQARTEALRCLDCKNPPCVADCPVGINIPKFLKSLGLGNTRDAWETILESNLLPGICGRVCPQEKQCQSRCTVGKARKSLKEAVSIGALERYCADWAREQGLTPPPPVAAGTRKVAVVGSGPASLACAADLRRQGYQVSVFEAFPHAGGVLLYGIPEFRLPKALVEQEVKTLKDWGVDFQTNVLVGRTRSLQDLREKDGYEAVFLGLGAGLPMFLNIPGENLNGVFAANEYLTRSNLLKAGRPGAHTPIVQARHVAVIGGGNVALDAARTAWRLGAEKVTIVYRRTLAEMPARAEELEHALEEGVEIRELRNPVEILATEKGWVRGLRLQHYTQGEPDAQGRRSPVALEEFSEMDCDAVVVAVGNGSNPLLARSVPGLNTDPKGRILTDEEGQTSVPGVWAGGDIVRGAATVILAMGEGRKAAASIHKNLQNRV